MAFQHSLTIGIDLTVEYWYHASTLETEVEAANPGKERRKTQGASVLQLVGENREGL